MKTLRGFVTRRKEGVLELTRILEDPYTVLLAIEMVNK
jgi:hypothetical protein